MNVVEFRKRPAPLFFVEFRCFGEVGGLRVFLGHAPSRPGSPLSMVIQAGEIQSEVATVDPNTVNVDAVAATVAGVVLRTLQHTSEVDELFDALRAPSFRPAG